MSRHKKPCPTPIEYRNVSFYNMKDLDKVADGIDKCSSLMNSSVEKVEFNDEYMIAAGCKRKYASAVSNWAEWKYDLYSKPIERPVLTPFDVH